MVFPYKPSILGVPPYQETPIFQELLLSQPVGPGAPKRARMVATILSFPTWRKTARHGTLKNTLEDFSGWKLQPSSIVKGK